MLNHGILTARPSTLTFRQVLSLFSINCMSMIDVFSMSQQFKVFNSVVRTIKILMIHFKSVWNRAVESFPNHSVNSTLHVLAGLAKINIHVTFAIKSRFKHSVSGVTSPSFSASDGMSGSNASVKKFGNLFQSGTMNKHFFGFMHFGSVNRPASGNSTDVSDVAYFVQSFKSKNRFPYFHAESPFKLNRSIA